MSTVRILFAIAVLIASPTGRSLAADPRPDAGELPRLTALSPKDALKSFRVREGFRMQTVAAEPLVADPMAMTFDAQGRMYVVELHGYPEKRLERLGKIKRLTDTDGDGVFDRSTVFAENLGWPSAIICYDGGVFVGCTPDIWFMRDNDGDGEADEKKVVFTGFSPGTPREIAPRLFNSFRWGFDNRIYAASSMNGGIVRRPDQPEKDTIDLRRHDFSFDPRTFDLRKESGTAQHGLTFNRRGHKFTCRNSNHIITMLYDWRYADRNPHYTMPNWKLDIGKEGRSAKIFRISPDEPWRVLRTRWRTDGLIAGSAEGGKPFGFFTSATGVTVYHGNAFPKDFLGCAFIGAPANNLVHRKVFDHDTVQPLARRASDELNREFIASTDNWFRPVQFANAPDGTLYIADLYRELIEVAHAIPESIKAHLNIYSGTDRGRIYRVVPHGFQQPKSPDFRNATVQQLVATLAHPNGWHRDTASRLLFERNDAQTVPLLNAALEQSGEFAGRIRALYLLRHFKSLSQVHLLTAMNDRAPGVREHALKLGEEALNKGTGNPALWSRFNALVADPDPRVRFQLALSLGESLSPTRIGILAQLALNESDPWIHAAILSSLKTGAVELFQELSANKQPANEAFLRDLIQLIGASKSGVSKAINQIVQDLDTDRALVHTAALGAGLRRSRSSLRAADSGNRLKPVFDRALKLAGGTRQKAPGRIDAVKCLAYARFETVGPTLIGLINISEPEPLQLAALNSLDEFSGASIPLTLIERWSVLTPALRARAMRLFLRRSAFTMILLRAIERGQISSQDIPATRIRYLRSHANQEVRAQAETILGKKTTTPRAQVITQFMTALNRNGRPDDGAKIFTARCATCHRFKGQGHVLGPDLETTRSWSGEELLTHILDPNRKVEPNQRAYAIETKSGESYLGLIASESSGAVALRMPLGITTSIPRANIRSLRSQGVSLMPEGLEFELSAQGMADLIAFLKK
jgi:putative membrane-bound dehydrogenase-like protein